MPASPRFTRRLTWLYISALSAVALLTLVGQVIVQRSLAAQRQNTAIVNIAGRQRMLSQQITKTALLASEAQDKPRHIALLEQLSEQSQEWQEAHKELQASASPAIRRQFAQLQPHFDSMNRAVMALRQGNNPKALNELLSTEPLFLAQMDAIVLAYDLEAQQAVQRLQSQERLLLVVTLLVLLAEGLFVFRPAVQRLSAAWSQLEQTLDALATARQSAEAASLEKSRFLARVSHELRTPLNAISGFTRLALDDGRLLGDARHRLQSAHDAAVLLARLVDDLLEIGRYEGGGTPSIHPAPVELPRLVGEVVERFRLPADERGLLLISKVEADVPAWITTDGVRLAQILSNLLGNAVKFTDEGRIHLIVSKSGESLLFSVSDTGPGIAAADHDRVFDTFSQLSTGKQQQGAGLGLAIVRRLAEALGGAVSLSSRLGAGSTFQLTLPLVPCAAPTDSSHASPARPLRILLVEDLPANQWVATDLLHAFGHSVTVAGTAAAANELRSTQSFDVILLDLELPDASGLELAQQWRDDAECGPPLVALTAHALPEYREACRAAGFVGFVTKPIDPDSLAHALHAARAEGSELPDASRYAARPELLASLARLYTDEWPRLAQQMRSALDTNDREQLRFVAHRCKGLVANFTVPQLESDLAALESDALSGDVASLSARIAVVVEQLEALDGNLQAATRHSCRSTVANEGPV